VVITQEELKRKLYYDPETGVFTWLQHRWLDRVGEWADSFEMDKGGFLWLDYKKHRTNRLAFLYMTGEIPVKVGFKGNNIENVRWDNLVVVTDSAASYKAKRSRKNTSGYKGVSWSTHANKWRAMCRHAGKHHFLGYHETAEAAKLAYDAFASRVFGEFLNSG
jgi:hypothetical protein